MIELKECSEVTTRREVYEFDQPHGEWDTATWTRVERNGELEKWVPHDGYGEMMSPTRATGKLKEKLEELYQQSDWS